MTNHISFCTITCTRNDGQAAHRNTSKKQFPSLNVLWVIPAEETMADHSEERGELLQGTLDLLILKALTRGPMHGYGVAEWIHASSQDVLSVEEGALYPALHRLELRGLLDSEWGSSENNRRAKFYSLT